MVNEFDLELKEVSKGIKTILKKYGSYLSEEQLNAFEKVQYTLKNNFGVE